MRAAEPVGPLPAYAAVRSWLEKTGQAPRSAVAPWASEILDAFDRAGIRRPEDVTEDSLGRVEALLGKTVGELLGKMRSSCPVGRSLPKLSDAK